MKQKIEEQLLSELSVRNIEMVVAFCNKNPEAINILLDNVFIGDDKLSMRSAWALEKLCLQHDKLLQPNIDLLVKQLDKLKTSSVRRIVSKILMLHSIPEDYEGEVLDFCLSMIENPKEPVAVKANCMTTVFNLLPKYPELKNEIFTIIEDQIPYNSVGFKSRFNVLKRKLKIS